jgi:hypothetical protein
MSRAMQWMTTVCVTSLLANIWLYRELRLRERTDLPTLAALPLRTPATIPETKVSQALISNVAPNVAKQTMQQMMDKCRKQFEADMRQQYRDPRHRENLKKSEIMMLQARNVGAQTRLQLNDQAFGRILELQAEQNLSEREASIGRDNSPNTISVDPEIASEFGEPIAAKWVNYLREFRARAAVEHDANLLAEANVPLSGEQRRKLVGVYTDEFEMQGDQNSTKETLILEDEGENPNSIASRFKRQFSELQSFALRTQADAASFLTPTQLGLLHRESELELENFRSFIDTLPNFPSTPETADKDQVSAIEC